MLELRGVRFAVGASDVAVWADEVGAVAFEAGFVRFFGPRKFVEGEAEFDGQGANFGCGGAVDVKLPVKRSDCVEIAASRLGNPRKAVAAAESVGIAAAERAVAIFDADLRGETE